MSQFRGSRNSRDGPPEHLTSTFQIQPPPPLPPPPQAPAGSPIFDPTLGQASTSTDASLHETVLATDASVFSHDISHEVVGAGSQPHGSTGHNIARLDVSATAQATQENLGSPSQLQSHGRQVHFEAMPGVFPPGPSPCQASLGDASQFIAGVEVEPGDQSMASNTGGDIDHGPKRLVLDPPDLDAWRQKLFDADDLIILTNEQYETYFPHVDNVYSHRSTQRYKRKPFLSHYYDCRLKGRPPGTPKSDDPNKKKRKRTARELNQCDVKIKITEYFPGATLYDLEDGSYAPITTPQDVLTPASERRFRVIPAIHSGLLPNDDGGHEGGGIGCDGQKFWTIQRINGPVGGSGVAGPHKHDLARSDEVKKNSIQRLLAKKDAEAKKAQLQRKVSGAAAATVRKRVKENKTKLFASCFCPFSQRVWIALEAKRISYQYVEMDSLKKSTSEQLLEVNPKGTLPTFQQENWSCSDTTITLEYLEDASPGNPLLPSDPQMKGTCRIWHVHINTKIVPAFYGLLRASGAPQQAQRASLLRQEITPLVRACQGDGPYFLGENLSLVDIHFAPFALRLSRIMEPHRGWVTSRDDEGEESTDSAALARWIDALEKNPHVRATTSAKELYTQTMDILLQPASTDTGLGNPNRDDTGIVLVG